MMRFVIPAVLLSWVCAGLHGQASQVEVEEPTAQTILVGRSPLALRLSPSAPTPERVTFHVDGIEACVIIRPPWACEWDAGAAVMARTVRAVVDFGDGRRDVRTIRTRHAGVVETASVESVLVPVRVTDQRGRFVPGLSAEVFSLREDGVAQTVTVATVESTPAFVILGIDISASMSGAIDQVVSAADLFLQMLAAEDSAYLAAFNTEVFTAADWTQPSAVTFDRLRGLRAWGSTALHDALITLSDRFGRRSGRRVMVLFTDGEDRSSRGTLETVRIALQQQDIQLHMVAMGRGAGDREFQSRMQTLTAETGGTFVRARLDELPERFRRIGIELREQYLLAYTPSRSRREGGWRAITVTVRGRYTVRAREGYFAVPGGSD